LRKVDLQVDLLYEIFSGEAGEIASSGNVNKYVEASFKTMRFIVTVGWSIYPLGYYFGYLMGSFSSGSELDLQPCGFCEQDRILLGNLGFCQTKYTGRCHNGVRWIVPARLFGYLR